MRARVLFQSVSALALASLASACTVGPNFKAPAAPSVQAGYGDDGGGKAALGQGPELRWWTAFGSDPLDALVDRAILSNHSLEASRATLASARQRIAAVRGRSLPQIDANSRAEQELINLAAFGFTATPEFPISNPELALYTVGGGVSYDLDLFGKNRRSLEQARAAAEAQMRETEAAHLTIAGRVVMQVFAIAAANDRIAAQNELLADRERTVNLTRKRERAGVGTQVEILSAEAELVNDRAGVPALEQQLAEGRAMLAVLLGISVAELGPTDFHLAQFALPAAVPVALPSALVHQRPDILESESRLHSATAAIGVATANMYPDITLGVTGSFQSNRIAGLVDTDSRAYDLFAQLTAPIFHGGTLTAQKRGAEADARAAVAKYEETVIEAFGQVSGLLSALQTDARALEIQRNAVDVAGRSRQLSRRSFEVGNSGVLTVIEANRSEQQARLQLVDIQARQYTNVARLYVATAGGWMLPEQRVATAAAAGAKTP
jgi:NodT family efflux transporter outer membrane factor (OMF) lipoprotein